MFGGPDNGETERERDGERKRCGGIGKEIYIHRERESIKALRDYGVDYKNRTRSRKRRRGSGSFRLHPFSTETMAVCGFMLWKRDSVGTRCCDFGAEDSYYIIIIIIIILYAVFLYLFFGFGFGFGFFLSYLVRIR